MATHFNPRGVAVSTDGRVYVAQYGACTIGVSAADDDVNGRGDAEDDVFAADNDGVLATDGGRRLRQLGEGRGTGAEPAYRRGAVDRWRHSLRC